MKNLIEALTIFLKYGNPEYPTHCEHDQLSVLIDPAIVSEEDKKRLDELGFRAGSGAESDTFYSFRYGSC